MPLVQIALTRGRSPDTVRAIADGVHEALVETFQVPADDRFQIVRQLAPGEMIFDRAYLGVDRSDDLVMIEITASAGRDTQTKQRLYAAIARRLAERPGVRPEDVLIVLTPNAREDWSFGRGVASYVERAAAA